MKTIITYGTYDMLHIGHINLLTRAKARGDYLIVGVTSDDYDRSRGKLNVVQSQEMRVAAIKELDFVDKVIFEIHKDQKQEDIVKYDVDEFVIGDDWKGYFDYLENHTKVIYLPRTKGISSTKIRNDIVQFIKIGIVGANGDARRFIKEQMFVDFTMCTHIYDPELKNIESIQKKLDIEYSHTDLEEFLEGDFQAVYICSDISDRYDHIKRSLLAGKHILCENPLAIKECHAQELFSLAKQKNLLLLMALKTAFAPAFNKLLDELKNSTIGSIREVRATFTSLYRERGFPKRYISHGATNLLMSYPLLIIHKIAGRAQQVTFFDQTNGQYDTSNRAITTHDKDIVGIATVGIEMKSEGDAVISGTRGYIYIPAPWWLTKEFYVKFEDEHKSYKFEYEFAGDGLRYMISEFASLIWQGRIESERLTIKDILDINRTITLYNKDKNDT